MSLSRTKRLIKKLEKHEIDVLLVSDIYNVRYLTGFTGTNGLCLIGSGTQQFVTDFRYREQAQAQVKGFDVAVGERDLFESSVRLLAGASPTRLGIDHEKISVSKYEALQGSLSSGVEMIQAGGLVEGLRAVKDEQELDAIDRAASLADEVFISVIEQGVVGRSEREIAWEIEKGLRESGAQVVSFPPIVASGPNGALPHADSGDERIAPDTLLVIDWGCVIDGYASDCTRTVATGTLSDEAESVYNLVRDAQRLALESVAAGIRAADVDSKARTTINDGGYAEMFGHGTGHGVGLEVHEEPRVSQKSDTKLQEGNVITIEPGIYVPGKFGVRIEDLVVVKDDGCKILTGIDKKLRVVS